MAGLAQMPRESEPILDPRTKGLSRPYRRFFLETRVQVVGVDTSATAQTIDLATLAAQLIVVKDESGNAAANPITLSGTIEGAVNPTISTNYGFVKIYGHDGLWFYWG